MAAGNTYEAIATQTLSSSAASVTFSSIPSTYTDLILVCSVRDNTTGTAFSNVQFQYNGDTGSNYSWTEFNGYSTFTQSQRSSNTTGAWGGYMSSIAGIFTPMIIHIMNYSNTTTNKISLGRSNLGASSPNTNNYVEGIVSIWRNTAAINSIKLNGAISFASGSTFSLYGIASA